MNQNLVDDHLKEQRRNQREQLQEERSDKNFSELMAVFVYRTQEPVTSNRRDKSASPARRVISTRRPSHVASNSVLLMSVGRGASGACTKILSLPALARSRKLPSRRAAIAGKVTRARRSQSTKLSRAFRPSSLAQRSISGMQMGALPKRCRICSGSAATP